MLGAKITKNIESTKKFLCSANFSLIFLLICKIVRNFVADLSP